MAASIVTARAVEIAGLIRNGNAIELSGRENRRDEIETISRALRGKGLRVEITQLEKGDGKPKLVLKSGPVEGNLVAILSVLNPVLDSIGKTAGSASGA